MNNVLMVWTMAALVALLSIPCAWADEQPNWFYPTCQRDLKVADSFADDCLKNARTQTRYFNGAPETHSYYFWPGNSTDSHFGMGCMVGADGKIMYLGMYYTTHPKNWAIANTAQMRYIDFQGNVGLVVDGEPVNLLGVRQFKTDKIPARYTIRGTHPHGGSDTNCEFHSGAPGDWIEPANEEGISISESKDGKSDRIKWCVESNPDFCRTYRYNVLVGNDEGLVFYHGLAEWDMIRTDGTFLFLSNKIDSTCTFAAPSDKMTSPSLIHEICPKEK